MCVMQLALASCLLKYMFNGNVQDLVEVGSRKMSQLMVYVLMTDAWIKLKKFMIRNLT